MAARILDGSGGAAVSCLGHQHPRVIEAIARQASKLAYAHTGFFSSEPAEEALADRLVGDEPVGLAYAYLVSGGSEAIEASIKLARQYFYRTRSTATPALHRPPPELPWQYARGVGGWRKRLAARQPYAPLLSAAFSHVTPAFAYHEKRDDESEADFVMRLTAELEAEFRPPRPRHGGRIHCRAVVGATSGCVPPPEGYFRAVRDICDRHGALLILDEVMCGMGRTGTLHAWEQEGIAPDIQAIAKGLGGGYQPIGAMLASARIIDTIRQGSELSSTDIPISPTPSPARRRSRCSGLSMKRNCSKGSGISAASSSGGLTERFGNHRHVGDIRGRGLFQAIELVADRSSRAPFDPALKLNQRIKAAAFERGLACYPAGGTVDGRSGRPCPARTALYRDIGRHRHDRRQARRCGRQCIENGWSLGGGTE